MQIYNFLANNFPHKFHELTHSYRIKYCSNFVQILWEYCVNIAQISCPLHCANVLTILSKYCANFVWVNVRILSYNVQILCKYCANIVQILCKYCANIAQILCKYCTNIMQIFFESNRAIQEHTRLNRAKCYPLSYFLTFSVKFQFIELHTQLKI